ncbi:hypothetical protein N452_09975 [Clostridium botulinum A2 117]|nr:hypothetical protein N452_09975 [Clostridium botulinum A2 117]MBN3416138.1 hypothetical protein [Clostridium botulinum]MBN3442430.1 hypothetical protein [Clostridium botulinum]
MKRYKHNIVSVYVRFLYGGKVFRFIYKFRSAPYRNKWLKHYKKRAYISSLLVYNKSIIYGRNSYGKNE